MIKFSVLPYECLNLYGTSFTLMVFFSFVRSGHPFDFIFPLFILIIHFFFLVASRCSAELIESGILSFHFITSSADSQQSLDFSYLSQTSDYQCRVLLPCRYLILYCEIFFYLLISLSFFLHFPWAWRVLKCCLNNHSYWLCKPDCDWCCAAKDSYKKCFHFSLVMLILVGICRDN